MVNSFEPCRTAAAVEKEAQYSIAEIDRKLEGLAQYFAKSRGLSHAEAYDQMIQSAERNRFYAMMSKARELLG